MRVMTSSFPFLVCFAVAIVLIFVFLEEYFSFQLNRLSKAAGRMRGKIRFLIEENQSGRRVSWRNYSIKGSGFSLPCTLRILIG
jgi:hypothetical protein